MYGIADIDNCYCSCERVFRPDLEGRPVVVLSNNDGCVVARSNEAKRMGIQDGTPYFQLAQQYGLPQSQSASAASPSSPIAVFSSNYELYGELTSRVVSIISQEVPSYFRYSIDECFLYLDGIAHDRLLEWGRALHRRVRHETGIPISIGLAPNKTLAKIASKLAKKYEDYGHCCMIDDDTRRERALEWCPIEDVWGIGRRYASRLSQYGVRTALDFAKHHKDWVRQTFNNVNILRTWQELNGQDAVPNEELARKKSICTSRSFNGMISDFDSLRTQVANYACRCAEKLRMQHSVTRRVGVFLTTNSFREDLAQYWNFDEKRLLTPSNSTGVIVKAAGELLLKLFRQGYQYKKAGVIVVDIVPDCPLETDLFDLDARQIERHRRLDDAVDRINRICGSETVVIGAQQYALKREEGSKQGKADVFANSIRHEFRSKNPTTRWSDIISLNHCDSNR